jgi:Bacterial SH3 domain
MATKDLQVLSLCFSRLICLLVLSFPSFCHAGEATRALTVREAGATLYSQQEAESDKIATLQKGQLLTPLAEAVGQQTWYMVKTPHGLVGWVRAMDVSAGDHLRQAFKEQSQRSSWSALSTTGRTFEGSWTVEPASSADKASGTWTLGEGLDKTVLRGTWSAQKFSTGWSGTWRATVEGQKREFTGSWTADFPQAREPSIGQLFSTMARDAIRGIWSAENDSGSWAIRTAK